MKEIESLSTTYDKEPSWEATSTWLRTDLGCPDSESGMCDSLQNDSTIVTVHNHGIKPDMPVTDCLSYDEESSWMRSDTGCPDSETGEFMARSWQSQTTTHLTIFLVDDFWHFT